MKRLLGMSVSALLRERLPCMQGYMGSSSAEEATRDECVSLAV